ncbi:MAG: FAD-dependent oxidoreductase [Solirubrobacterales bacterium]
MPPLRKPADTRFIALPPRQGIAGGETDVLVVGGGQAGLGAALGAAGAGARVILAERYGFLGGNATAALVMPWMSFHAQGPNPRSVTTRLMPNDHGPGPAVVAGVVRTFLERLVRAGGALRPALETGYTVPFDPEIFKLVAMDLLDEAGVQYLLHSLASGTFELDQRRLVIFETKSGPVAVSARVVVDCTGDGDMAARAGAAFEVGRQEDGLVQPMTLMFRMAEFQDAAFLNYAREHPDQWRGVHGLWDLIRRATEAGELNLAREDLLMFGTPHEHEVAVNSTRITRVLGVDVWDLTYAEWEGRRQMRQIVAFLRRYVPGFKEAYLVESGANVGVRESRRIVGEYQLTADDVLNARRFDDVVARGAYPLDVHNPEGKGTSFRRLPPGQAYDIPLRTLIPKEVDRLLVAGRCISGTHEAQSTYRVMPIAMATGQAAGVCAALAASRLASPRDVPASDVQSELLRQGADLGRSRHN